MYRCKTSSVAVRVSVGDSADSTLIDRPTAIGNMEQRQPDEPAGTSSTDELVQAQQFVTWQMLSRHISSSPTTAAQSQSRAAARLSPPVHQLSALTHQHNASSPADNVTTTSSQSQLASTAAAAAATAEDEDELLS